MFRLESSCCLLKLSCVSIYMLSNTLFSTLSVFIHVDTGGKTSELIRRILVKNVVLIFFLVSQIRKMFSLCLVSVKILDYVTGHERRSFSRRHTKVVQLTGFPSSLAFLRVTCKVSAGLLVRGLLALKEPLQYQAGFCLSCQQYRLILEEKAGCFATVSGALPRA